VNPPRPITSTAEWCVVRRGLHVQSLSEWAPACIGPYSQAQGIELPHNAGRLWWLSGQIGLQPSTLTLASPHDPSTQLHLTLQHITRVLDSATHYRLALTTCVHGTLYFVPSLLSLSHLSDILPREWVCSFRNRSLLSLSPSLSVCVCVSTSSTDC
jgi:enamine deaminase RidA (YjgF/YER057c/UK114 family)